MSNRLAVGGLTTPLETSVRRKERHDILLPTMARQGCVRFVEKNAHGTGYKVNKCTKGKVISKCLKCQNHVCGKHRYLVCRICKEME